MVSGKAINGGVLINRLSIFEENAR